MSDVATLLRGVLADATPRLLAISDAVASRAPAPGRWSPKEVLGHLVDSASNNHQRFVRAQLQDDLFFSGYEQDRWVEVQRYASAPWSELVGLWHLFNLHLARVIEAIPPSLLETLDPPSNLRELAWNPPAGTAPMPLGAFLRDYVGHLEHHLAQVLGSRTPSP